MLPTKGYAAKSASSVLAPFSFERREVKDNDVLIQIDFCGVCHSDIHQVKDEWGGATYPMVPGHEIVGHVTKVGKNVKNFKLQFEIQSKFNSNFNELKRQQAKVTIFKIKSI